MFQLDAVVGAFAVKHRLTMDFWINHSGKHTSKLDIQTDDDISTYIRQTFQPMTGIW